VMLQERIQNENPSERWNATQREPIVVG
jgi:hypothetical protein